MPTANLPIPKTDDPDTAGFWEAARRHEVAVCYCASCGEVLHLPRGFCASCQRTDVEWRSVAPSGTLYSWIVAVHEVHPAFEVPYTSVLVELDDLPGVRLAGFLPGEPKLSAHMTMRARFEDHPEGHTLVQWEPAQ